ncbi:hypothetical protein N7470_010027 [Penicillium chermesinum]|nr:hypothetical protein N7470_010027 [Penicillium chermesinum]
MSSRTSRNEGASSSNANSNRSNNSRQRQAQPGGAPRSLENEAREFALGLNLEIAYYHAFLNKLLNVISKGDDESIARVISVIRSGASYTEILDVIDQVSENNGLSNGDSNSGFHGPGT